MEKNIRNGKKVNWNGADVVFLPEYPEDTSADAITKIAGMFRIVDFKYSSTRWNTLQADLEKGFTQAEAIVLKLEKMNSLQFIKTIEYMKRNRMKLGDIKLLNAQGHGVDLTLKDLQSYLYKKKARKLL